MSWVDWLKGGGGVEQLNSLPLAHRKVEVMGGLVKGGIEHPSLSSQVSGGHEWTGLGGV